MQPRTECSVLLDAHIHIGNLTERLFHAPYSLQELY